jgi:transposase-like protein
LGNKSKFTPHEKAEIILQSLKSPESISEICRKNDIAPVTFSRWKKKYLMAGLDAMMGAKKVNTDEIERQNEKLKLIIGELFIELDYIKKKRGIR